MSHPYSLASRFPGGKGCKALFVYVFIADWLFFLLRMFVQFICPFVEQITWGVCLIWGYFILELRTKVSICRMKAAKRAGKIFTLMGSIPTAY